RDVLDPGHVCRPRRQPVPGGPRSPRQARRLRGQRLGARHPVQGRARRARARSGPRLSGDLPRASGRRASHGDRRPRRGAVGGRGWGGGARGPAGARFIAPDASGIARILAKHAFLKPLTVPAGSYPGLTAPLPSVGSWSFILGRPGLPDEVAYRLARALHHGEAAIARRLPQAEETTAANTLAAAPRPDLIHPGVLRYLREIHV